MFGFSALSISPFSTDVEVRFDVSGVSAIASTNPVVVVALANTSLASVAASSALGDVVVTADSITPSASVSATSSLGNTIVVAKAVTIPLGLASTGYVGITTVVALSNTQINSPALGIIVGNTSVIAKAVVTPTGVVANSNTNIVGTSTTNVFEINSPPLNIYARRPDVHTVQFNYELIKDSYSRNRVIYIDPTVKGFTVDVPADPSQRTLYIEATNTDRVVRIAA